MKNLIITDENECFLAKLILIQLRRELNSFLVLAQDEPLSYMNYSIGRFHAEHNELKNLENCTVLTLEKIDNHLKKYRQVSLQEWIESI